MARRRVSGGADYIIPLAVLAAVGIAAWKIFGLFGQSAAGSSNNAATDTNAAAAASSAFAQSSAALPQSQPDTLLSSWATQIYNSASTGGTGDTAGIVTILSNVNNLTDLYRLIQLFGTKQVGSGFFSTCSLLGFDCTSLDLQSFVAASVTPDQLAQINQNFSGNGINYQF